MEEKRLEGVIPPMITPFTPEGEIDEKALRNLIRFLKGHVHGLFICGSYGSGPLMSYEERKGCAEITVEEVSGQIPVIVQVGTTDTKTAVKLAKHGEESGASRIASVPPYYYEHTEDNIISYFQELVEAVKIPVYVYNNPKAVGYSISPALLSKLANSGVFGVKDSSFDIMIFADFIRKVKKENFDVVMGTEALFLPASALGARAFIPGLGNAFPELVVELYETCKSKDYERARKVHERVLAVRDLMRLGGSTIVSVYEMLKMRGIDAGLPKVPFHPLGEEIRKKIYSGLINLGLI